jgi:trimeric autotransporter adhesin
LGVLFEFGTSVTGGDVVVNSSGRLGVLSSSPRYKRDIQPLDENSSRGLWQLRPVTFHYKQDPQRQYGLIAEEVAKAYPELVVRGDKEVESAQYRELIPLMLNEMRRIEAENTKLEARVERLERAR